MNSYFVPLKSQIATLIPGDLVELDIEALDSIWARPFEVVFQNNQVKFASDLLFEAALVFDLPIVDGVAFTMGGDGLTTVVPISLTITDELDISGLIGPISTSILINSDFLRPARVVENADGNGPARFEIIPNQTLVIEFGSISLGFDLEGNVDFDFSAELTLPPAMIGDSGFVIEASGIIPVFSELPPGTLPSSIPSHWRGVFLDGVTLHLPPDLDVPLPSSGIHLDDFFIGTGGISGTVAGTWDLTLLDDGSGFAGLATGKIFGIPFGLRSIDVEFFQSIPISSSLAGEMILPFFDSPVGVDVSVDVEGGLSVGLSAVQPEGVNNASGLVTIEKEGLLSLTIDSLGFGYNNDVAEATLSGSIKPLIGAPELEWPAFKVNELAIDSDGNVRFDGGWLDLPEQYTLDLYGFQLEITKLGFGKTEDGGKWIGFSGGLKLVEGMPAGASVEGLRITWYEDGSKPAAITFNGVGVEFEVPETLRFKGEISYEEENNCFKGEMSLDLIALELSIDGQLVVGFNEIDNNMYMAFYLGLDLPAGIPLGSTGLGLYGLAGLVALNYAPDKLPDEKWYDDEPDNNWYKKEPIGVTGLDKWAYESGGLALGAGVTIGTASDNGLTFSGRMFFIISFPGPVLMLEGMANILKERAKLNQGEPDFRAFAVLDATLDFPTFLIGLDARYKYGNGGELIDIGGSAEAYFENENNWHLYLGEDTPKSKRIHAKTFGLFQAQAYFMLDPAGVALGAWVGYEFEETYGPVNVSLGAWMEGGAAVSWKPAHFYGYLWLHGNLSVSVFGFGFGFSADAKLTADVFDPFMVLAEITVSIDLPWPFDDINLDVDLQWGPELVPPPLPVPLKEVAIEHLKVTTSWPLLKEKNLLSDYVATPDGFLDLLPAQLPDAPPDSNDLPVIPMDARPCITFSRAMHDDALIGINPQPPEPAWEQIGDPANNEGPCKVRYGLKEISLEKWVDEVWVPVGRKGPEDPESEGIEELFGSWANVPAMSNGDGQNVGQVKLMLWSKTPFDFTRFTSNRWDEWFTDHFTDYPCIPNPPDRIACCDFEDMPLGDLTSPPLERLSSPLEFTANKFKFNFDPVDPPDIAISQLPYQIDDKWQGLNFGAGTGPVIVELPEKVSKASVTLYVEPDVLENDIDFRAVEKCVDIREKQALFDVNPLILDEIQFSVQNVEQPQFVGEGETSGLDTGYLLDILLPCTASTVKLLLSNSLDPESYFPNSLKVTAFNKENEVRTEYILPGEQLQEVQLADIWKVGITRIEIQDPHSATVLHKICYECVGAGIEGQDALNALGPNPLVFDGTILEVYNGNVSTAPDTELAISSAGLAGLDTGWRLEINLPHAATSVSLLLTQREEAPAYTAHASAYHGELFLDSIYLTPGTDPQIIQFVDTLGQGITRIFISDYSDKTIIHKIQYEWLEVDTVKVSVVGYDSSGQSFEGVWLGENEIEIDGIQLEKLEVIKNPYPDPSQPTVKDYGKISIAQVCVNLGWDPAEFPIYQEMTQHLIESKTVWEDQGDVLEPDTTYRLKIVTTVETDEFATASFNKIREQITHAYFCTEGPPGLAALSIPETHTGQEGFRSGLDDLTPYVQQTIPISVPDSGERPFLLRPVYRAFDVGVEFNEDYVDLLYRLARRDLGLYLYDNNNQPVRDAEGRLIILNNQWGHAEELLLGEGETRHVYTWNESGCVNIDTSTIPPNMKLISTGQVLDSDTLYEARLVPLLLHEDFGSADENTSVNGPDANLIGWTVYDQGPQSSPTDHSVWSIFLSEEHGSSVRQTASGFGHEGDGPVKPGSILFRGDNTWTDYRLSVFAKSSSISTGAFGAIVRYNNGANAFYCFSMDRECRCRRLVRVVGEVQTILAEDDFVFRPDWNYLITFEAIGARLRVYLDGQLVFDVLDDEDEAIKEGGGGLYCWKSNVTYRDVRVDDFCETAPVVYRFKFTTSNFTNFFHHLHSFNDEIWPVEMNPDDVLDLELIVSQGLVNPDDAPSEDEARAFETLAERVLKTPQQNPSEIHVTRVEQGGAGLFFLVQSPEPIDWKRTHLDIFRSGRLTPLPELPGKIKITDATFGETEPNEESVSLLLRETLDPTGYFVEYQTLPEPISAPSGDPILFRDSFVEEPIGPPDKVSGGGELGTWTITDGGGEDAPSLWRFTHGGLVQYPDNHDPSDNDSPGTYAVSGDPTWANYRFKVTMRVDTAGVIGAIFRYIDNNNYYRFSLDTEQMYWNLGVMQTGEISILAEGDANCTIGQPFTFTVDVGPRLIGYVGTSCWFDLPAAIHTAGQIGLYCSVNTGARFERVEVRKLPAESHVLLRDHFAEGVLDSWEIVDEDSTTGSSNWLIENGILKQSGDIVSSEGTPGLRGTQIVTGEDSWDDLVLSAKLNSLSGGSIGLVFRYTDQSNYYRFSMDTKGNFHRLEKNVNGEFTLLWDGGSFEPNFPCNIIVAAVGTRLNGYSNGCLMFSVEDGDLPDGRIGLFCSGNQNAHFSQVLVYPPETMANSWLLHERFDSFDVDEWNFVSEDFQTPFNEWLVESSVLKLTPMGDAGSGSISPRYVLGGDPNWTDYRLSARLHLNAGGAIGVLFRYLDENNFYKYSMDPVLKNHQLIKTVDGQEQTLAEIQNLQFGNHQDCMVTIECVGENVIGYMGCIKLFEVHDRDLSAGRIGLYCLTEGEASFSEVNVAEPIWMPYYSFSQESPLHAGTQVQILSGNVVDVEDAFQETPGVIKRFASDLDESGRFRFSDSGYAALRLQSRGYDASNHSRHFLPMSSYSQIAAGDIRVLRKADGTAFFIFVDLDEMAETEILESQYRLKFTYVRDNSELDPGSSIYRQEGYNGPEEVVLDLPWETR